MDYKNVMITLSKEQENPITISWCFQTGDNIVIYVSTRGHWDCTTLQHHCTARNICLILSTIYSFISVSVCIDMDLSALLWPGPILLIRRPWPYVIHHLHFMNMYRLYIAWYRPILLMYVWSIKLNIYFLYWYFQQNQCLKIKNYVVYNIHR
jgi:hypothetical protein